MRISPPLKPARFVKRLNRFSVEVTLGGRPTLAHLPNSGRLRELLRPGALIYVADRSSPKRKTAYDLALVRHGRRLVSVDARLPNHLVAEAVEAGRLREFDGYKGYEREVAAGGSRLDFAFVSSGGSRCLVEVKSVTLLRDGVALFPDAPTERGVRHLEVLARWVESEAAQALVLFVVQRAGARLFAPNEEADPRFAETLRRAAARGVAVRAYSCRVTTGSVTLAEPLGVALEGRSP